MNYLIIAGSSAAVYLFIVAAIRLFGKKELAQLSVVDLVFIMLISNAVQNAMVGSDTSLLGGLCAAISLFVINSALKYLLYKFPSLSKAIQGEAIMLVHKGEIIDQNLKKARVTLVELEETAREHGVKAIVNIDLAVLEIDGNISILSQDYSVRTTHHKSVKKATEKHGK